MVWLGQSRDMVVEDPVPFITSTAPSFKRQAILTALTEAGRS